MTPKLRAIGPIAMVLLGTLAFPWVLRRTDAALQNLRDALLASLQEQIERTVTYRSLDFSVFQEIEIRDLKILGPESRVVLSAQRVVLHYDLWKALWERAFLIQEIRLLEVDIDLDQEKDADILQRFTDAFFMEQDLPPSTIVGSELNLVWRHGQDRVEARGLEIRFENHGGRFSFSLDGQLSFELPSLPLPLTPASARASAWGLFDRSFHQAVLEASLSRWESEFVTLRDLSFRLDKSGPLYSLRTIKNPQPIDVRVDFRTDTREWTVALLSEQFQPIQFLNIKGPIGEWDWFLRSRFTGVASLVLRSGGLSYSVAGVLQTTPPLLGEPLTLEGSLHGDATSIHVPRLSLSSPTFKASYTGSISLAMPPALNGEILVSRWTSPQGQDYSGRAELRERGEGIAFALELRPVSVAELELKAEGSISWQDSGLLLDWSSHGLVKSSLILAYFPQTGVILGNLAFDSLPLVDALQFLQGPKPAVALPLEAWRATCRAQWSLSPTRQLVTIERLYLTDEKHPTRNFEVSSQWLNGRLELAIQRGTWDGNTILGGLSVFQEEDTVQGWGRLEINEEPYESAIFWSWTERRGYMGQEQQPWLMFEDRGGELWLSWAVSEFRLPTLPVALRVHSRGEALFVPGEFPQIEGDFSLSGEGFGALQAFEVDFHLHAERQSLTFQDLTFADRHSQLRGGGMIQLRDGDRGQAWLSLSSEAGENLVASLSWGPQDYHVSLNLQDFPLGRLSIPNFEGRVHGQMHLSTRSDAGETISHGRAQLNLSEARWGRDPLSATAVISWDQERMAIERAEISLGQFRLQNISVELLQARLLKAVARGSGNINEVPVRLSVSIQAEAGREVMLAPDLGPLDQVRGSVRFTEFFVDNRPQDTFSLTFIRLGSVTTFSGGPGNSILGRLTDDGGFRLQLSSPLPVTARAEGSFQDGRIEAKIEQLQFDAALANLFFGKGLAQIQSGTVSGSLSVKGLLLDPELDGKLIVTGLQATTEVLRAPIGPVDTELKIGSEGLVLNPTTVKVGTGRARLSGGLVLTRWIPARYTLEVLIDEDTPVPIRYAFSAVNLDGFMSGSLSVQGSPFYARLSGNVTLQETLITLSANAMLSNMSTGGMLLDIDLLVTSGSRNLFVWPVVQFPIVRAYLVPRQSLIYRSLGASRSFWLSGKVQLRGGEIFYLNQVFFLREGELRFNETQNQFDPYLMARAEYRTRLPEGPLIVILSAEDFLSQFSPRLESVPSRTAMELAAILGQEFFLPRQYTQSGLESALGLASDVGSGLILRPFEAAVKEALGLDMFTVRTQIIRGFVLGGVLDRQPTVGDYLDNTSVFWGKYLSEDIFVEGLFNLSSNRSPLAPAEAELVSEFELGLEMRTPWMTINWRFAPKNPSELFVPDNTVQFTWRWTY